MNSASMSRPANWAKALFCSRIQGLQKPLLQLILVAHRYSDVMKQDVLKQAVARVVQSIIAALAAAVAGTTSTEDSEPTARLVLPTLAVLLEWWSLHPSYSK